MERKDVKWEEIREKERELFNLEEQYYQQKKELDDKALDFRNKYTENIELNSKMREKKTITSFAKKEMN